MGKEALAESVRSGECPWNIPQPVADPNPTQHGLCAPQEPSWGWQQWGQPGECPLCPGTACILQ